MSFSFREVALAAPLSLSILSGIPAAALAAGAPERAADFFSIPAIGMSAGIAVIVINWAAGVGVERAAQNRKPGEVLHP